MNPYIYLHEIIRTVPGREEPYMAKAMSLQFDPARHRAREVHCAFGQFRSTETSGAWPSAINIWENTWWGKTDDFVAQFQDQQRDVAMEEWWNPNLVPLVVAGEVCECIDELLGNRDLFSPGTELRRCGGVERLDVVEVDGFHGAWTILDLASSNDEHAKVLRGTDPSVDRVR